MPHPRLPAVAVPDWTSAEVREGCRRPWDRFWRTGRPPTWHFGDVGGWTYERTIRQLVEEIAASCRPWTGTGFERC